MDYKLVKSSIKDVDKLFKYKMINILEYAHNLSEDEIKKINKYAYKEVNDLIDYYNNIIVDNKSIGCLSVTNERDGKLLDEIYLEEEYRNNGIGTSIIKKILNDNNKVYLWVYKENTKAIKLYKRLGFKVLEETDLRYFMSYSK